MVGAPAASAVGTPALTVSVAMDVCLAVVCFAVGSACAVSMKPSEDGREEEEYAVHDTEGKAGLKHGAGLINGGVDAVIRVCRTKGAKVHIKSAAVADIDAVGTSDAAQEPDRSNKGADKSQVDNGHEKGVGR